MGKRRGHLYYIVLEKYVPILSGARSRSGRHGILDRDTSTERDVLSSASERVKKVGEGGDVWDFPTLTCHMEDKPMIYEVRTYTLRPGTVAEFEERFAKRLLLREKHSKLGAFWHTEFGPLNQVIH